jgi:hypothetical protein
MDHVVPISRGGPDDPTNKVLACASCNLSKGARLPSEWLESPPPLVSEIERKIVLSLSNRDPRSRGRALPQLPAGPIGERLVGLASVLEWQLGLTADELSGPLEVLWSALKKDRTIQGVAAQHMLSKTRSPLERQFLLGLFCRDEDAYAVREVEEFRGVLLCERRSDGFKFRIGLGFDVTDDSWECDCTSEDCDHPAPILGRLAFLMYSESLPNDVADIGFAASCVGVDVDQIKQTPAQVRAVAASLYPGKSLVMRFGSTEVSSRPANCFDEAVWALRSGHRVVEQAWRAGYNARGRSIEPFVEAAE